MPILFRLVVSVDADDEDLTVVFAEISELPQTLEAECEAEGFAATVADEFDAYAARAAKYVLAHFDGADDAVASTKAYCRKLIANGHSHEAAASKIATSTFQTYLSTSRDRSAAEAAAEWARQVAQRAAAEGPT